MLNTVIKTVASFQDFQVSLGSHRNKTEWKYQIQQGYITQLGGKRAKISSKGE